MNRRGEAAERFADRRRREDEAPRLRDVVPDLVACRIEVMAGRSDVTTATVSHTRHLVVDRAPALVVIPCSDPSCRDGGHDITSPLLRGFKERRVDIHGEDACRGSVGNTDCGRLLRFRAHAQYVEPAR